jgi:hypothetical protein
MRKLCESLILAIVGTTDIGVDTFAITVTVPLSEGTLVVDGTLITFDG